MEIEQHFVVRLKRDVTVHLRDRACLLKSLEVKEGEGRDLGFVTLRADEYVRVRFIGVWAKGAKEVWWLATDLPNAVSKVVATTTGGWPSRSSSGTPKESLRREVEVDAVHPSGVRRKDVPAGRRGAVTLDERRTGGRRGRAKSETEK